MLFASGRLCTAVSSRRAEICHVRHTRIRLIARLDIKFTAADARPSHLGGSAQWRSQDTGPAHIRGPQSIISAAYIVHLYSPQQRTESDREKKDNNNNNNPRTIFIIYNAVIMTTKGHCESSLGSFDECSAAHKRLSTLRPSHLTWAVSPPVGSSVQFSSVQFARINVVLSAKHFRTTTQ